MKVRFGSFDFEPWEADLAVEEESQMSKRGIATYRTVKHTIRGEVVGASQSAILTRLATIKNAFNSPANFCGLIDDSNNPIVGHTLVNDGVFNLTGIQVVAARFPETKAGEFVSGRNFEVTVASILLEQNASQVFYYRDTITRVGNAGPVFEWEQDKWWNWYPRLVSPNSIQHIIHSGISVGMDAYLIPPAPVYPPPFEVGRRRMVRFTGPNSYPNGFTEFTTEWEYHYYLPTFDDNLRPTVAV